MQESVLYYNIESGLALVVTLFVSLLLAGTAWAIWGGMRWLAMAAAQLHCLSWPRASHASPEPVPALGAAGLQINVAVISIYARGFFGHKTSEGAGSGRGS